MENFNKLTEFLGTLKNEAEKFYNKHNASAATRLRVGLQQVKKLAQSVREDVAEKKKQFKLEGKKKEKVAE